MRIRIAVFAVLIAATCCSTALANIRMLTAARELTEKERLVHNTTVESAATQVDQLYDPQTPTVSYLYDRLTPFDDPTSFSHVMHRP